MTYANERSGILALENIAQIDTYPGAERGSSHKSLSAPSSVKVYSGLDPLPYALELRRCCNTQKTPHRYNLSFALNNYFTPATTSFDLDREHIHMTILLAAVFCFVTLLSFDFTNQIILPPCLFPMIPT